MVQEPLPTIDERLRLAFGGDKRWAELFREDHSMEKKVLKSDKLAPSFGAFVEGGIKVTGASLIFISGQVAWDKDRNVVGKGDIKAQTRQALENLKAALEAGGAALDDVVKVTVFLTDMSKLMDVHEVRFQYFKNNLPASTLVEVRSLVHPDLMIEIEAIAAVG